MYAEERALCLCKTKSNKQRLRDEEIKIIMFHHAMHHWEDEERKIAITSFVTFCLINATSHAAIIWNNAKRDLLY